MDTYLNIDTKAMEILEDTLKIGSLDEVMDKEFNDHAPKNEPERKIAEEFRFLNRGSARFAIRSFYTVDELEKAKIEADSFILP